MNGYKKFKKRLYEIIGPTTKGDKASTVFDISLCTIVLISCLAVIIELFFWKDNAVILLLFVINSFSLSYNFNNGISA